MKQFVAERAIKVVATIELSKEIYKTISHTGVVVKDFLKAHPEFEGCTSNAHLNDDNTKWIIEIITYGEFVFVEK